MAQSKTSGKFTIPLMVLAFISAAGLLYWLNVNSTPTEFAVATEAPDTGETQSVGVSEFALNPSVFVGQRVQLGDVIIANVTGPAAVWFQFEDGTPYLVRLSQGLMGQGLNIAAGEIVGFTGTIQMMSDSILDAWTAEGVIADEGLRGMMEFSQTFMHAEEAAIQGRPSPADTSGS